MTEVDTIVVGLGIAGVVLTKKLEEQNTSFIVVDQIKSNSSSRIAAGIFNPVAYRNLKMAEMASTLLPKVNSFYPEIESQLESPIFQRQSFLKLLVDVEELNNWTIKSAEPNNKDYMSPQIFKDTFDDSILNPFGAGQVLESGRVNLPLLINQWREKLIQSNSLINAAFVHSDLQTEEGYIIYKNLRAKKIIFCEGIGMVKNPWFNWLPMQQFKGETLRISAPDLKVNRLINRGVFILPEGNGEFKIGATHDWRVVNEIPSEEGKKDLLEKVDKILNVPYTVINHEAGLRPASRDRKPMIGEHPEQSNMYIINGLGSKGVIWAPWLIDQFLESLHTKEWPSEFNIKRFHRFYTDEKN